MFGGNDDWLVRNEARGTGDQVRITGRSYYDAADKMLEALGGVRHVNNAGSGTWDSRSGDELRTQLDGLPLLMQRSERSTRSVGAALNAFAPKLDDFNSARTRLQREGSETKRRLEAKERQFERDSEGVYGDDWWEIGGSMPPELEALRNEMRDLEDDLDRLRRQFDNEEESFEDAVKMAIRLIDEADDVLYDSAFQQWWDQHGEKIVDIARTLLQIAAVVVAIASIIFTGGAALPLAAFIIAGALLATSTAKIVGTAAAHGWDEVTADMWMDFAGDLLGVITAGLSYNAKALSLAGADKADDAARFLTYAQRAEKVESAFSIGTGGYQISQGDYIGGAFSIAGGALEFANIDALDAVHGAEAVKIAGGATGAFGGMEDLGWTGTDWVDGGNEAIHTEVVEPVIEGLGAALEHFGDAFSDNPGPVVFEADGATAAEASPAEWPGLEEGGHR